MGSDGRWRLPERIAGGKTDGVNPRQVLGVSPKASAGEIRRVHRRHVERIEQSGSGVHVAGLLQLLDDLRADALAGRESMTPAPAALFGVTGSSTDPEVIRFTWRRLAALTHPDQGGTDGLFRLVSDAHDELTGARIRRRLRRASHREPPPPPPPPGPFRVPPPETRPRVTARTWIDLALSSSTASLAILGPLVVAVTGFVVTQPSWAVAGFFLWPLVYLRFGRAALFDAGRALVRLRLDRLTIDDDVSPGAFLSDRALDVPVGREWDDLVYDTYAWWCAQRHVRPLPVRVFMEVLRSYGLLHIRAPGWDRGLWVGLKLTRSSLPD